MNKKRMGLLAIFLGAIVIACSNGFVPFLDPEDDAEILASCLAYREAGETEDGIYTIDPDGEGGVDQFDAECDMTTDSGGWTLVLNYLHEGGTTPALDARTADLPMIDSSTLGTDESGSESWGHAGNELLSMFTYSESRWYCITSNHSQILHFKTSDDDCHTYLNTGTAVEDCSNINATATTLAGHTASLPGTANGFLNNNGDLALTEFPFLENGTRHWGISGGGTDNRWECDDFPFDPGEDTLHRVWIR